MTIKKALKWFIKLQLKLGLVFVVLLAFLLFTNTGLKIDYYLLQHQLDGKLKISSIKGRLMGRMELRGIVYKSRARNIILKTAIIDWSPSQLFQKGLAIDELLLKNGKIVSLTSTTKTQANAHKPFNKNMTFKPFRFWLNQLSIQDITLINHNDRSLIHKIEARATSSNQGLRLQKLFAEIDKLKINAHGMLDYQGKRAIDLQIKTNGSVQSSLAIAGNPSNYTINGDVNKPYHLSIKGHITKLDTLALTLNINNAYWPLKRDKILQIRASRLNINGRVNQYQAHLDGKFKWNNLPWLNIRSTIFGSLYSFDNIKTNISDGEGQMTLNGSAQLLPYLSWSIKSEGRSIRLSRYHQPLTGLLNYQLISDTRKTHLQADFRAKQLPVTLKADYSKHKAQGELHLGPGLIQLKEGDVLPIKKSLLPLSYQNNNLSVHGDIHFGIDNTLGINATMPIKTPFNINNQTISATLRVSANSLRFIDNLFDEVSNTNGHLNGTIKLSGKLLKPRLSTKARLSKGQTTINVFGLNLHDINLDLSGSNKDLHVNGHIYTQSGMLNVNGLCRLNKNLDFQSDIRLRGDNILVLDTKEYQVKASPNVVFQSRGANMDIIGDIFIPYARINPTLSHNTIDLPDDVVIINQNNDITESHFGYSINARLGDDVRLDLMGLTGNISGQLKIHAPVKQMAKADGQLQIKDGKYTAYGQHLSINKGELNYNGGLLINPNINLTAIRRFKVRGGNRTLGSFDDFSGFDNYLTVGIRAIGPIRKPTVTLFSNPASHSQADILSMLVLGRPIDRAQESDSAMLFDAISSLNLTGNSSEGLTEQLQHALGLDTLSIENESLYGQTPTSGTDNTSLVLGKALSKYLSVHYSIGLLNSSNILRIRYKLNNSWTLQTETDGQGNGIDIIYHYQRK